MHEQHPADEPDPLLRYGVAHSVTLDAQGVEPLTLDVEDREINGIELCGVIGIGNDGRPESSTPHLKIPITMSALMPTPLASPS